MTARAVGKEFQFCYTTELQEIPLSILMTCHYEDLSSTFDWSKQIYNQLKFCARSSDFIWRESGLWGTEFTLFIFYINARLVILSSALEISSQSGVIPARTSQKITATAYPSRRIAYKFKLSYELLSMFGMYALVNPGPFSFFRAVQCLKMMLDETIRNNDFCSTQCCTIVTTLFGIVTTLFQHCDTVLR